MNRDKNVVKRLNMRINYDKMPHPDYSLYGKCCTLFFFTCLFVCLFISIYQNKTICQEEKSKTPKKFKKLLTLLTKIQNETTPLEQQSISGEATPCLYFLKATWKWITR